MVVRSVPQATLKQSTSNPLPAGKPKRVCVHSNGRCLSDMKNIAADPDSRSGRYQPVGGTDDCRLAAWGFCTDRHGRRILRCPRQLFGVELSQLQLGWRQQLSRSCRSLSSPDRGTTGRATGGDCSPAGCASAAAATQGGPTTRTSEVTRSSKKGDWANAVRFYEDAARKSPNDKVIRSNLTRARQALQAELDAAEQARLAQQRDKAAADKMQQVVKDFSKTLTPAQASAGPDFDGRNGGNPSTGGALDFISTVPAPGAAGPAAALEFGDPMVVDARNVPSGLPKSVENAIPKTPAGDRVRKGFQAITENNWKAALVWFQDALNHEPGDPGLQRLVDLAQYTLQRRGEPAARPIDPATAVTRGKIADTLETGISEELDRSLNDYNKDHPPKWLESTKDFQSDADWLNEKEPGRAWKQFFRLLAPARKVEEGQPVINSGIRG